MRPVAAARKYTAITFLNDRHARMRGRYARNAPRRNAKTLSILAAQWSRNFWHILVYTATTQIHTHTNIHKYVMWCCCRSRSSANEREETCARRTCIFPIFGTLVSIVPYLRSTALAHQHIPTHTHTNTRHEHRIFENMLIACGKPANGAARVILLQAQTEMAAKLSTTRYSIHSALHGPGPGPGICEYTYHHHHYIHNTVCGGGRL